MFLFILQPADSTETLVRCLCHHATLFGSNFFVAPNKLDVSKEILNLANLGDYPALIVTICVILGLYILAMVWAKRKDRREAGKVSACMHVLCVCKYVYVNMCKYVYIVIYMQ